MEFSIKEINSAIESLVKSQARTTDTIEKVLVMAVFASIKGVALGATEPDYVGVANSLLKVLRTSMKRTAIVAFLEAYGKLGMTPAGVFKHFNLGSVAKLEWTPEYVETVKAAARNWEAFKPPVVASELDIEEAVTSLVSKAAKAQKAGRSVKNEKLLAFIADAMAKYHAAISA